MSLAYSGYCNGLGCTRKMNSWNSPSRPCVCDTVCVCLCVYSMQIAARYDAACTILHSKSCKSLIYMDTPLCMYVHWQHGRRKQSLVCTDSRTGIATFGPGLDLWVEDRALRQDMKRCCFLCQRCLYEEWHVSKTNTATTSEQGHTVEVTVGQKICWSKNKKPGISGN